MGEPLPIVRALRARRRALGLSVRAAAARAGLSACVPASWERGDRCPSLERACGYAGVLGLELALLPGASGVPVPLAACAQDDRRLPVLRQLRATRLVRELPVAQVAAAVGVTRPAVTMWENGERRIQLDQAHGYADALGLLLTVEEISASVTVLVEAGGTPSAARRR
ncbi:helix-turn-helix domain-containing protein [Actinomadura sp. WMMA1423]|uniref:helix-turn-helix domain-containing protein n=1 Tax=Actinomadura sp. WMMA1423 TaxID=2591108 RepID=UPI0011468F91|nr:helix-turn-helix domain-containing protein [Actinomadura sp. WMMA1423]